MAHWRLVQTTNCKVPIALQGCVDLELSQRDVRQTEQVKVCKGEKKIFHTSKFWHALDHFFLDSSACHNITLSVFRLPGIHNTHIPHIGMHKQVHGYSKALLKPTSLQLPWAVAFIAEGIRGDVNKAVGWGEITFLAKTKVKATTMSGRWRGKRGESQPKKHAQLLDAILEK